MLQIVDKNSVSKKKQFTATVFIVKDNEFLFIFHKKHKKWLPPGGHLDPDELPSDAAVREAFEETGLHIELLRQENVWVEMCANGRSFERPYMCLLEEIPERIGESAHQHMDFIYVGRPIGGSEVKNECETDGLRWFTLEEINRLSSDEIFPDTKLVVQRILKDGPQEAASKTPRL